MVRQKGFNGREQGRAFERVDSLPLGGGHRLFTAHWRGKTRSVQGGQLWKEGHEDEARGAREDKKRRASVEEETRGGAYSGPGKRPSSLSVSHFSICGAAIDKTRHTHKRKVSNSVAQDGASEGAWDVEAEKQIHERGGARTGGGRGGEVAENKRNLPTPQGTASSTNA